MELQDYEEYSKNKQELGLSVENVETRLRKIDCSLITEDMIIKALFTQAESTGGNLLNNEDSEFATAEVDQL
jgi:hypothetical protein